MAIRLSGKTVSLDIKEKIKLETETFIASTGITPTLAVILVGTDPASQTYVESKKKACIELGFGHKDITLSEKTSQNELLSIIDELNNDSSIHGILVQHPLPKGLDEDEIFERISPCKDVDGFHPVNVGLLSLGKDCFVPCTPKGILAILNYYDIKTSGKKVVVIGRSNIVGKPMANLLLQKGWDATVTICHSRTKDLKAETLQADIVIVATGMINTLTADMVKEGAVVIDVGVNRIEDKARERGYRVVGDVDYENVKEVASAITPVPGGVGPMTITMLMQSTLEAAKKANK